MIFNRFIDGSRNARRNPSRTSEFERCRRADDYERCCFFRHLNTLINEQRQRDRSLKAREEAQVKETKKRNQKMLQTVSHHFPGIEIVTKLQKHQDAIEELARPRVLSSK